MSESDPWLWQILLQVILIILNALFACAEIAVISMNDVKIQRMSEEGDKRAARLAKLTDQPARFLSTIQVGITFAGFLASAFAADNFSDKIVSFLADIGVGIPTETLDVIAVVVITIVLSYFMLVFGELVPKRIAMHKAERLALAMSGFVYLLSRLFAPLVGLLTVSTNAVLRLFGVDPHAEAEAVTEEEIRMLLDTGSENGTINKEEREMIKNIFEFNDKIAEDVMTHRTEVSLLWMDETPEQWEQTITESRHSRYPVCNEDTDDIVGVLNIKDYYRVKDEGIEAIKEKAIQPAYFVPETIRTDLLFKNMQKNRNHFAVVLDEYGGMSGIVTMSDLIEEIVGEIDDSDRGDTVPDIERIDSQTWKIRGGVALDEIAKALDVTLPVEDFDTFGGFVFGVLNSIPEDGAKPVVEAYGLTIRVEEIKEHRMELAIVCKTENNEN
ncbi:MAG: Magnesium and cobalt efflux protein CorC [Firmicutes bacterium ADurb.Bin193]|nr:MAG: Magnesium and cobalt efflux protein CorC [Firmicutes bacterium ADurb.Bin193]